MHETTFQQVSREVYRGAQSREEATVGFAGEYRENSQVSMSPSTMSSGPTAIAQAYVQVVLVRC